MFGALSGVLVLLGIVVLAIFLGRNVIMTAKFVAISAAWGGACLLFYGMTSGSTSTLEYGAVSIKPDLKAVQDIKKELQGITRLVVENTYIVGQSSFLVMTGSGPAGEWLSNNLQELSKFVERDLNNEAKWWDELKGLVKGKANH